MQAPQQNNKTEPTNNLDEYKQRKNKYEFDL